MDEVRAELDRSLRRRPWLLQVAGLLRGERRGACDAPCPHEGCAVVDDARRGGLRTVACRAFQPCEAIFAEEALVSFPPASEDALRDRIQVAIGSRWTDTFGPDDGRAAAQIASFVRVDNETRVKVLALYTPPANRMRHYAKLREVALRVVEVVPEASDVAVDDLCRLLCVADVNCTGNHIFQWLSRLQHSCHPNTMFRTFFDPTRRKERLVLYSVCFIAEGEELTFAYQGNSTLLMLPVAMRRHSLLVLGFACTCCRCLEEERLSDSASDYDPLEYAAARLCVVDGTLPPGGSMDLDIGWRIFKLCRRLFGPGHWTTGLLCFALLDAFTVLISRYCDDINQDQARFDALPKPQVLAALCRDTLVWFDNSALQSSVLHARAAYIVSIICNMGVLPTSMSQHDTPRTLRVAPVDTISQEPSVCREEIDT